MNQTDLITKPPAAEPDVAINVRSVPLSLRKRFKMACAAMSVSMEARIIELIEQDVEWLAFAGPQDAPAVGP